MGWWTQDSDGRSFEEGCGVWGDGPADIMDSVLDKIETEFEHRWRRKPSIAEIEAGLRFSLGGHRRDELEATPEEAEEAVRRLRDAT